MDTISGADTAWVLMSAALVILMTPALGLFYGGLVRAKNALSTLLHSLFLLGAISLQWALVGYSLAFAPDIGGWGVIGGFDYVGLAGVGSAPDPAYAPTIPASAFMVFQLAFAVITPALISGAFAERKKFSAFVLFSLLWATLVYDPVCHWVWGQGGWLRSLGALDFAGGTVVHVTSGVSALVCARVLGPRTGGTAEPHNTVLVAIGTMLILLGWQGFNSGSALAANGVAASAFVTTHLAASAGAITWYTMTWLRTRKAGVEAICLGLVAGLVAITPAAGFVSPTSAILIGVAGAGACSWAIRKVKASNVDDALDVFGVHGVGGAFGALLTGVLATSVSWGGVPHQLALQALAVGVVASYSAIMTWGILRAVSMVVGLRVSTEVETDGLDLGVHGETAYRIGS